MVTNDQSIEVPLEPQSTHEIEQFVETICDQLAINDIYYGNILISITTLFEELLREPVSESLRITYSTDHQVVRLNVQPVGHQLIKFLELWQEESGKGEKNLDKLTFLLHTLVDHIWFEGKDAITLEYDISALHNRVWEQRQSQIHAYFNHTIKEQVQQSDDQL
jgi:hypothetical protein